MVLEKKKVQVQILDKIIPENSSLITIANACEIATIVGGGNAQFCTMVQLVCQRNIYGVWFAHWKGLTPSFELTTLHTCGYIVFLGDPFLSSFVDRAHGYH